MCSLNVFIFVFWKFVCFSQNPIENKRKTNLIQNAFQTNRFFCSCWVAKANWLKLRPPWWRTAPLSLSSTSNLHCWFAAVGGGQNQAPPSWFPYFLLFIAFLKTTLLLHLWAPPYWALKPLTSSIKPLTLGHGSAVTTLQPPPMMEKVGPHR